MNLLALVLLGLAEPLLDPQEDLNILRQSYTGVTSSRHLEPPDLLPENPPNLPPTRPPPLLARLEDSKQRRTARLRLTLGDMTRGVTGSDGECVVTVTRHSQLPPCGDLAQTDRRNIKQSGNTVLTLRLSSDHLGQ